jgi:integration host factor subunit alpha
LQHKKERLGRNPKSGIDAVITARRSVKFLPSPVLRAKVNGEDLSNLEEDAE